MNCRRADALIQRGLDGALTEGERRDLGAHLAGCAACRAAEEEYRRLAQSAAAWTRRPSEQAERGDADAFTAQVLARIEAAPRERVGLHRRATFGLVLAVLALLSCFFDPGALPALAPMPDPQAALALPGWLWAGLRALPADAWSAWSGVRNALPRIAGLHEALLLALIANALLVFHALRRQPSPGYRAR